mmetsp:Transcript_26219/g.67676  ORF Transcript_26219/g.67676 Transcript_26219/m.67676 type:complete len:273 (+) Transcript_26219:46-864(+)
MRSCTLLVGAAAALLYRTRNDHLANSTLISAMEEQFRHEVELASAMVESGDKCAYYDKKTENTRKRIEMEKTRRDNLRKTKQSKGATAADRKAKYKQELHQELCTKVTQGATYKAGVAEGREYCGDKKTLAFGDVDEGVPLVDATLAEANTTLIDLEIRLAQAEEDTGSPVLRSMLQRVQKQRQALAHKETCDAATEQRKKLLYEKLDEKYRALRKQNDDEEAAEAQLKQSAWKEVKDSFCPGFMNIKTSDKPRMCAYLKDKCGSLANKHCS